jgi:predicted nucleic acid-binding protein
MTGAVEQYLLDTNILIYFITSTEKPCRKVIVFQSNRGDRVSNAIVAISTRKC